MSSRAQGALEQRCCPRSAMALDMPALVLRGGLTVSVARPGAAQSVALAAPGAHLLISIAGGLIVSPSDEPPRSEPCRPHLLYILRQSDGRGERRVDFDAATSLAVVVSIPQSWCTGCPRGPECGVGRFLMHGRSDGAPARDETIELDLQGQAHARALLDLDVDEDADVLIAEQRVLALLTWAYAKHSAARGARVAEPSLPPRTLAKLRLAADILSERLDDPPTIAELSALVGMNECDLKRCFKCVYGDGIASFSRNRRLAAAQDLLMHSALSVAEVALEVGYANPSQFARAFRQQFDINPAQYRRAPRPHTR